MVGFKIGKLPLGRILWLAGYHYGPFYGWKVNIVARILVGKLPLWLVLCLVNYRYDPFMIGN